MRSSNLLALAASLSTAAAVYQGFNYGASNTDGSFKYQADFQAEFQTAKGLVGTSGFTSARLYTMIQGGSSTNEPTQAIPAAIAEGTTLLLTLWASAGQGDFSAELSALQTAITQYGTAFTNLVAGLSVGSEDLYRISPTGIAAKSGYGAEPSELVAYIGQLRSALASTPLSGAAIGHVDTWTAWVNGSNQAVIDACDWIGMDAYPYFQNTESNGIGSGKALFNDAYSATQAAVGGKEVWITETGWPVSGSTQNLAVPSLANAQTYWDEVGCPNFGKVNTWWFTLQDASPTTPNPSFGIVGSTLTTTPLYNLSCSAASSSTGSSTSTGTSSSSGSSSSSSSSSSSGSGSTGTGSSSGSSSGTSGGTGTSGGSGTTGGSGTSSAVTSLSTGAGGAVVSGGSGLTPSEGAGNGVVPGTTLTSTPSASSGNSSSQSTGSQTAKTTSTGSVSANGGAKATGSLVGAVGALLMAVAAL